MHRYDVVGEDNLDTISNTVVKAVAKTPCCLLELNVNQIANKQGIIAQAFGFFNNKINHMQHNFNIERETETVSKNRYIALAHFAFMFMIIISAMSILSRFQIYLNWSSEAVLLHHIGFTTLVCLCLLALIKPLNFSLLDLGLTTINFRRGMLQAIIAAIIIMLLATGLKDVYVQFRAYHSGLQFVQPTLPISENFTWVGLSLYLMLYITYIFMYELCSRGILQNIFEMFFFGTTWQYWGSIFAAAIVASQLHISLFNEFSIVLLIGNVFAGIIFANTRNLWAVFIYHVIFSVYLLTVLGLVPSSHF